MTQEEYSAVLHHVGDSMLTARTHALEAWRGVRPSISATSDVDANTLRALSGLSLASAAWQPLCRAAAVFDPHLQRAAAACTTTLSNLELTSAGSDESSGSPAATAVRDSEDGCSRVQYADEDAFWREYFTRVFTVAPLPGVATPAPGSGPWRQPVHEALCDGQQQQLLLHLLLTGRADGRCG
ncbi:MAG: hypothetical protein EOO41_03300, partial [Methanobacteriota archaeon]